MTAWETQALALMDRGGCTAEELIGLCREAGIDAEYWPAIVKAWTENGFVVAYGYKVLT